MAPSPALRCSPGWEHMAENGHKSGRSFESVLTFRNKDDDLALFNEIQNQEKDNFLLHTADDFEESISKLRHFSDFKLGINIPTRGESSNLLNQEGDKNDYDWLLTPPDTPLFPSLDDEYSQPINLVSRGRSRSQSITSRSLTDKSNQTSRTSSSPNRLSPSPRSSGKLAQMRWRSSSVPRSGASPAFRSTTPTRRSSTPNEQSTHTPRSSIPTLQRPSTVFSIHSSNYVGRGPSIVNASRGNCSSPKLPGWKMTLPSFTLETPPNLCTSLSDLSVTYTKGSSPTSGNARESSKKLGRKSMSPTSSRSTSSSHGQERNCFSSYSKCSMVSSGDDDDESLHFIRVGISRSTPAKKDGALESNKIMSYSRKPSGYSPTNSIPKRSFDSVLRLMAQHKTPHNMFRPLLSSAPATTVRPIFSRNSSLTTSSNASSEQGLLSVALDVEGSELEPTELHAGWERTEDSETQEEIFLFDKVDEIIEDTNHAVLSRRPPRRDEMFDEILSKKFDSEDIHKLVFQDVETSNTNLDSTHFIDNHCDKDGHIMSAICSKCSKEFKVLDLDELVNLCQECAEDDRLCTTGRALTCVPLTQNDTFLLDLAVDTAGKGPLNCKVPEFHHAGELMGTDCLPNICSIQLLNQRESELSNQHFDRKRDTNVPPDVSINAPQLSNQAVNPSLKVDIPEGTGISVLLLHGSGSSKWPILQGKTVSATNVLCFEPSYSRDNINYFQRSIGRDIASASSAVALGSSKQTENSIHHQLSREGGADNMRNDTDGNSHSKSLPVDFPMNCCQSGHLKSESEQTLSSSTECLGYESLREIILVTEEHEDSFDQSNFNDMPSSSTRPVIFENFISKHTDCCMTLTSYDSQNLNDLGNSDLPCSSAAAQVMCNEDGTSSIHADEYPQNNGRNLRNIGGTDIRGCSVTEEDYTSQNGNLDAATKRFFILTTELPHVSSELEDYHTECIPSHNPAYTEQSNGHSVSQISETEKSFSTSEPCKAFHEHGNHEYSGIIIERPRGHMSRSLTLEEATDTILFCSSIIHDLAYQAATIGIEKELNLLLEAQASDPYLTNPAKPITGLREPWKVTYNQTRRSHKFKRKRMESQTKYPHKEAENDVNAHELSTSSIETPGKADTGRPPKLESKCNCTVM
ncbi:uncharacterized protein LOC110094851 [Dendrobium catenatum]|uniref:Uncharacterized protein n=1 Tax=Dendrobium catenatum TaxID=906689 RepID=A0A2I0VL46_9ASPA|nr:uncharacterized protein LOC110094851 [Dendrobium catenatum]XP_028556836.1 uncharacterized protein LOC110094851 [Dendrobium catenatum]PKU64136.1 hypothetical protein MA16_Dca013392 [Dendrobium catenatum]